MPLDVKNQEVRVRGTVQGVGFRPTVYRLAKECQLYGEVSNDTDGVFMRISGIDENIQLFLRRLQTESPPLAKIEAIETFNIKESWSYQDFTINKSKHSQGCTEIAADSASCPACLREIFDPSERRYLYPFTNCTHCGPRLSIIEGIPYDRDNTTMANFPLCDKCNQEYSDPVNRRFHAQPIACYQCGPQLLLHSNNLLFPEFTNDLKVQSKQKLQIINEALQSGKIVALKGLGGFHLCCDATNHESVSLLRKRKQRYVKPFALMCHDILNAESYCHINSFEKTLLTSFAAPIVLLVAKQLNSQSLISLSNAIAPGSKLLGVMLPYTPLHSLISQQFGRPLVMTSGNISGESQVTNNIEAIDVLGSIADLIVYHDRDIANRIDDSVVRCVSNNIQIIRRARGYAPASIKLPDGFQHSDKILAYGAELKSTFCLLSKGTAILSQHQGDLENVSNFDDYEKNISLYKKLFKFTPEYLAFDIHPEYLSSKMAKKDASELQLDSIAVQHHHAHIASAMAENNISISHQAVLGIALDGIGYGNDQTLWGGEFLLTDYFDCQRLARFKPVAMPGAVQAIKQPWRNTIAHILNSMSWDEFMTDYSNTEIAKLLKEMPIDIIQTMLKKNINCPLASSTGRLFDAVAGAIGLSALQVQYEGQAAIELEMLADSESILSQSVTRPYQFSVVVDDSKELIEINANSIWPDLLRDLKSGETKSMIATRFHAGLIDAILNVVDLLSKKYSFQDVVLSGGCMHNAILLQGLNTRLVERQFNCLTHSKVPANDGGIALGQVVIAAARKIKNNYLSI